jgi:hypothetical protein
MTLSEWIAIALASMGAVILTVVWVVWLLTSYTAY